MTLHWTDFFFAAMIRQTGNNTNTHRHTHTDTHTHTHTHTSTHLFQSRDARVSESRVAQCAIESRRLRIVGNVPSGRLNIQCLCACVFCCALFSCTAFRIPRRQVNSETFLFVFLFVWPSVFFGLKCDRIATFLLYICGKVSLILCPIFLA